MHSQPTGDRADDGVDAASDGPDTRPATPERGGVDVLDLLLIRQPVVEGWTRAVRDLLADWADDNVDGDAHALLPVDGVTLATLFLDDGGFGWTDGADDAINWLKRLDRVQSWVRGETETVEAEAMYTESLLLEGKGTGRCSTTTWRPKTWTTSTRPSTTPTAGKLGSPSGRCGACLRPPRRSSMRRWRRTARS